MRHNAGRGSRRQKSVEILQQFVRVKQPAPRNLYICAGRKERPDHRVMLHSRNHNAVPGPCKGLDRNIKAVGGGSREDDLLRRTGKHFTGSDAKLIEHIIRFFRCP